MNPYQPPKIPPAPKSSATAPIVTEQQPAYLREMLIGVLIPIGFATMWLLIAAFVVLVSRW